MPVYLGLAFYNPEDDTIDYRLAIEKGERYKPYQRKMEDKTSFRLVH